MSCVKHIHLSKYPCTWPIAIAIAESKQREIPMFANKTFHGVLTKENSPTNTKVNSAKDIPNPEKATMISVTAMNFF